MEDTIVAISTSLGVGAISIVRLSGVNAIKIAANIFQGKDLNKVQSHTINHGFIIENNKKIDEVLVSVMKSPKTYTTEDIVEINCHGGIASTNKILELCLINGARLAEPGEFTKRAFLNNRLDLTQAEAVEDIITSTTDKSLALSMNQLTGNLKNLIIESRKIIMSLIANIEVNIDFPEYDDAENITIPLLKEKLVPIMNKLNKLLKESENAKIIKDGINIAIVGSPNVGKSSLLNAFLEEDKAIVTNIAGTTRDTIEGSIVLNGIKLNFIDTAGIRKTKDLVEQIGVNKSKEAIKKADMIIFLIDNNRSFSVEDENLLESIKENNYLIFINKDDLPKKIDVKNLDQEKIIFGNTKSIDGIKNLKNKIANTLNLEQIAPKDSTYLTNARQKALIIQAINSISLALKEIDDQIPVDIIEIEIRNTWNILGDIIGATYKDELLDELFSNFCLGK